MDPCTAEGCDSPAIARGLCNKHRQRLRKHGSEQVRLKPHGDALKWIDEHAGHCEEACLFWPFYRNRRGYAVITLKGRPTLVGRVMCERVNGPPPSQKLHAAHSCGSGHLGCANPCHMRWATAEQNAADKLEHGTHGRGERNAASRLSEDSVRAIRSAAAVSPQRLVAAEFGIVQQTVSDIVRGKRWGWLQ